MHEKKFTDSLHTLSAGVLLVVFLIGSFGMFGAPMAFGAEVWLAILFAFVLFMPVFLIWGRVLRRFAARNLFEMLELAFGPVLGKALIVLYLCYFFAFASMTQYHTAASVQMLSLQHTPLPMLILLFAALVYYLAKSGASVMGKCAAVLLCFILLTWLIISISGVSIMRVSNLLPVLARPGYELFWESVRLALLYLGNAVVFLSFGRRAEKNTSPYRMYLIGAGVAVLFLAATLLRERLILGSFGGQSAVFASFTAAGVIDMGQMGTRIELFALLPQMMSGILVSAVYVLAVTLSLRHVLKRKQETGFTLPVLCATALLAGLAFSSFADLYHLKQVFLHLAPFFQLVIPLLLLLLSARARPKPERED